MVNVIGRGKLKLSKSSPFTSLFLFMLAISLSSAPLARAADVWSTDLDAAKKQAANDKKDLLILFTGSSWCPACIKLEKKVLSQADFQNGVTADFVPVKLDFPKDHKKWNRLYLQYAQDLDVEEFPTVVLADAAGVPYAYTGLMTGIDGAVYVGHLKVLKNEGAAANQLLAEGRAATDESEKIQKITDAIGQLTENGVSTSQFMADVKTIALLDKTDSILLNGRPYRMQYVNLVRLGASKLAQQGKFSEAHLLVDGLLAEIRLADEEKQAILFGLKGMLYEIAGDVPKALQIYKDALALAPSSPMAETILQHISELEKPQSDIIKPR